MVQRPSGWVTRVSYSWRLMQNHAVEAVVEHKSGVIGMIYLWVGQAIVPELELSFSFLNSGHKSFESFCVHKINGAKSIAGKLSLREKNHSSLWNLILGQEWLCVGWREWSNESHKMYICWWITQNVWLECHVIYIGNWDVLRVYVRVHMSCCELFFKVSLTIYVCINNW